MKKNILLILGVGILLFMLLFKLDIRNFYDIVSQRLSWSFYLVISFTIVMQLVGRSLRFRLLQKAITGSTLKHFDAFLLTSSSFFVALATPSKIGDISRGLYAQENKLEVTAISIIEYLFDTLIVILIPAFTISLLYEQYASRILLMYFLIASGLVLLYLLKRNFPSSFVTSRFPRLKLVFEKLALVQEVIRRSLAVKLALLNGFLFTCLIYGIYFVLFYAIMHQLGDNITVLQAVFAAGTGVFLGTLSFIPMGLGARDASIYGILVSLGTEADIAMSAVLVMRSLSIPLLAVSSVCYFLTVGRQAE